MPWRVSAYLTMQAMEGTALGGVTNGEHIRTRLATALRAAMKNRDTGAISGLRSALAAIANAEAIPAPARAATGIPDGQAADTHRYIAGGTAGLGASEAGRRMLTGEELARILAEEIADRQQAARQYQSAGHSDRAARLLHEAQAIQSALGVSPGE